MKIFNFGFFFVKEKNCFFFYQVDNIRLTYDNVTRKTRNTPGVEIKLPEFGHTEDLEWVDTTPIIDRYDFGAYFYHIAYALIDRGYSRGNTLFGAPYDFRKGPSK